MTTGKFDVSVARWRQTGQYLDSLDLLYNWETCSEALVQDNDNGDVDDDDNDDDETA